MGKKEKLPRGVGRVPEWWLEITPHDTLYIEEEEAQRRAKEAETLKFAQLAAEQDFLQKYGGEGFPNWNPTTDGPRTKEEEKEWLSKGYKRNEKEEWVNESGIPLEGRQFQGKLPPGYIPGQFNVGSGGTSISGPASLNPTKYERDKDKDWEKPAWMKVKLRSTDSGGAIRHGEAVERPITKGDGTIVTPKKVGGNNNDNDNYDEEEIIEEVIVDEEGIDDIIEEEIIEEVYEDEDGNEVIVETRTTTTNTPKSTTPAVVKARVTPSKPDASNELQAILKRRNVDGVYEENHVNEVGGVAKAKVIQSKPQASDELQAILNRRSVDGVYEEDHGNDDGGVAKAKVIQSKPQASDELQKILNRRSVDGVYEEDHGNDVGGVAKAKVIESKPQASDELQKILNRRKQASD